MWRVKFASIYQVEVASPGTPTPSEPPRRLCLTFARQQAKKPAEVMHQLSWMECLLLQQSRGADRRGDDRGLGAMGEKGEAGEREDE